MLSKKKNFLFLWIEGGREKRPTFHPHVVVVVIKSREKRKQTLFVYSNYKQSCRKKFFFCEKTFTFLAFLLILEAFSFSPPPKKKSCPFSSLNLTQSPRNGFASDLDRENCQFVASSRRRWGGGGRKQEPKIPNEQVFSFGVYKKKYIYKLSIEKWQLAISRSVDV